MTLRAQNKANKKNYRTIYNRKKSKIEEWEAREEGSEKETEAEIARREKLVDGYQFLLAASRYTDQSPLASLGIVIA